MHLLPWLFACREPEPKDHRPKPETTDKETINLPTGTTGETATDTGTPIVDPCTNLIDGPFSYQSTNAVMTEEDFDFDAVGYLLTQNNTSLAGFDRTGQSHIIAPAIGSDAAGIRSLVTGDIMIAQPDTGALRRVTYSTGATITVLGGLNFPNGLEAGVDGYIYSSEFTANGRIRMVEPYSGAALVITQLDYPNNMALSPDETTLYIVASNFYGGGGGQIWAIDRDENGEWQPETRLIHDHPTSLGGITTDICGNIYFAEYSQGKVYRLRIDDFSTLERIADLPPGSYSSMRFTSGIGDWGRTELFVTSRYALYVIDVGIDGRHVLAD